MFEKFQLVLIFVSVVEVALLHAIIAAIVLLFCLPAMINVVPIHRLKNPMTQCKATKISYLGTKPDTRKAIPSNIPAIRTLGFLPNLKVDKYTDS